jgi:rhomboid protease GluP
MVSSRAQQSAQRSAIIENACKTPQGGDLPLPYRWQQRIAALKSSFGGLFGGGQQRRPGLCPACGTLVGINATRCHQCGTNLTFSLTAVNKKLTSLIGTDAPVTTVLLIANFLMLGVEFILTQQEGRGGGLSILWGMGGEATYRLGSSLPVEYLRYFGSWWRLVTAMFLHGGLIHIGFNMMALYQLGPAVEELYGFSRFLFLYVVTGAFGFLCSSFTGHVSLGASGALLGLVGVLLAVTSRRGGAFMRQLRAQLISSTVILFAIGFMPGIRIDNWAHGGGLAAGFVMGKIFADRQPANATEHKVAAALGWLAGIAVLACFVLMLMHFRDPLPGSRE